MFFANSATGISVDRLDDLLDGIVDLSGKADFPAVSRLFGGCDLIGSPMIRDDGLGYARKANGQPYGRRRIQQLLADADFLVWRAGIPATIQASWHAHLDNRMAQARDGALVRTGHAAVRIVGPIADAA
jgi:hypothetical protein